MALVKYTRFELMVNRYAVIKNETFALPGTLGLRHLFEVIQHSALEVIDLFKALLE